MAVRAQPDLRLAMGFGSVRAQPDLRLAMSFSSEIASLELALAVRAGPVGARSGDQLAQWRRKEERDKELHL